MTLEVVAARRSILDGRALPDNAKVRAVALPFATRFILRGGEDVAGPVGAAFGVEPPTRPLASAAEGPRAALWLGPDEWLLIAEDEPADLASRLEAALAGVFHALVDVSHRQTGSRSPGRARRGCSPRACRSIWTWSGFPSGWRRGRCC